MVGPLKVEGQPGNPAPRQHREAVRSLRITTMAQFNISLGSAGSIEVDSDKFSPAVSAYVFEYGLKQMLNDAHASVTAAVEPDATKRAEAKLAMATKKLETLLSGLTASPRTGGTSDPVAKLVKQQAEEELTAAIKAKGKKVADFKKATDEAGNSVWLKMVSSLIDKNADKYKKAAEATLKARRAATSEIDLEEFGL